MSPDFWWGVVAATGAWTGTGLMIVVTFALIVGREGSRS
jgi:hypothetical protein